MNPWFNASHSVSLVACSPVLSSGSEAMYILGGASTGEYGALLYATVLYGILGACGGMGFGAGFWVLSLLKLKLVNHRVFALSFLGILCGMGLVITRYVANKAIYFEQGVPMKGMLVILAIYGFIGLIGIWLGRIMLTQTPFKILTTPREPSRPMAVCFCSRRSSRSHPTRAHAPVCCLQTDQRTRRYSSARTCCSS